MKDVFPEPAIPMQIITVGFFSLVAALLLEDIFKPFICLSKLRNHIYIKYGWINIHWILIPYECIYIYIKKKY